MGLGPFVAEGRWIVGFAHGRRRGCGARWAAQAMGRGGANSLLGARLWRWWVGRPAGPRGRGGARPAPPKRRTQAAAAAPLVAGEGGSAGACGRGAGGV